MISIKEQRSQLSDTKKKFHLVMLTHQNCSIIFNKKFLELIGHFIMIENKLSSEIGIIITVRTLSFLSSDKYY